MRVINEIKGDTYKKLIDYVLNNCNQFSLSFFCPPLYYISLDDNVKNIISKYDKFNDDVIAEIINQIDDAEFMEDIYETSIRKYIDEQNYKKTVKRLEKYIINRKVVVDKKNNFVPDAIYFFKVDEKLKPFFLEKNSIYDWVSWNNSMENLCFYIDDFCFLTSVAHEKMLAINCRNEEEYEYLKSIGIEFAEKEFVKTNDVFIS